MPRRTKWVKVTGAASQPETEDSADDIDEFFKQLKTSDNTQRSGTSTGGDTKTPNSAVQNEPAENKGSTQSDASDSHNDCSASASMEVDEEDKYREQEKFGVYYRDNYDYMQHLRPAGGFDLSEHFERFTRYVVRKREPEAEVKPYKPFQLKEPDEATQPKKETTQTYVPGIPRDVLATLDDNYEHDSESGEGLDDDFVALCGGEIDSSSHFPDDEDMYFDEEDEKYDFFPDNSDSVRAKVYTDLELEKVYQSYANNDDDMRDSNSDDDEEQKEISKNKFAELAAEGWIPLQKDTGLSELSDSEKDKTRKLNKQIETQKEELVDMVFHEKIEGAGIDAHWEAKRGKVEKPVGNVIDDKAVASYFLQYKQPKLTKKALKILDEQNCSRDEDDDESVNYDATTTASTVKSMISVLSFRSKDETPEERSQRKSALRMLRRERRAEKKQNTLAFKAEEMRRKKELFHANQSPTGMTFV